jgi:hypothetical protein
VIKDQAACYVAQRFADPEDTLGGWSNDRSGKTFASLLIQLVEDYGLSPLAATDVLESAFYAAADEFLC